MTSKQTTQTAFFRDLGSFAFRAFAPLAVAWLKSLGIFAHMSTDTQTPNTGRGSGRFRLGVGADATGGDVDIELRYFLASAPAVSVEWAASSEAVPAVVRQQIVSYIERYLHGYLSQHPIGSLHVAVVGAGWFTERRNEPERAAAIALHSAIVDAKLPPPLLYAPPDA